MRRLSAPLPDESSCTDSPGTDRSDVSPAQSDHTAGFAFPRSARLLTARDYSEVFNQNKRFSDRYWTILVRRDPLRPARLGLAIAKKRAKRAVDRNKLKRVTREAFRQRQALLAGLEIVVMNRDAAASATPTELRRSIDTLLLEIAADKRRHAYGLSETGLTR